MAVDQVYVITSGSYSDYRIDSIWLTLDEAREVCPTDGGDRCVEVWPIGDNQRTVGSFHASGELNATTGEVLSERVDDSATFADSRVSVCHWPANSGLYSNKYGIRVTQDTQERADKVYSELKARVRAAISTGLPPEAIATEFYDTNRAGGMWTPTGVTY